MIRKYLFPVLAVIGIGLAIYMVVRGAKPVPAADPVSPPPAAPFADYVAGAGIVEASTENIAIGTPVSGVVTNVYVKVGDAVGVGADLFKLDDRPLQSQLRTRRAALRVAQEQLARLEAMPRPEEIPPLKAKLKEAEASVADLRKELALYESITDKRAVSQDIVDRKRFAVQVAEAKAAQADAALKLMEAGAWKPDVEVAKVQVESAEADVKGNLIDIERLTVKSPIDGHVLQVDVRVGEFAQAGMLTTPLMVVGAVERLHVRVDIDENDAWRVRAGAAAVGYARGNRELSTPLAFVRFEPMVVPKRSLTGESTERVDTRVLQAIYAFEPSKLPLYVGQQMDVYIQAAPADQPGRPDWLKPQTRAATQSSTTTAPATSPAEVRP